MIRQKTKRLSFPFDPRLFLPMVLLVLLGIVMVYSASSALDPNKIGSDYIFMKRQAISAVIGFACLVIARYIPYRFYKPLAYVILLASFALLGAVLVSGIGHKVGGAQRWLRFGYFSFQPAEFTRFAMVIYLAYSLSKKDKNVKEFSIGFVPHVVVLGLFIIMMMLQPDFGSAVILAALTWTMMFTAGVRLSHLFSSLLLIVPFAGYVLVSAPYRLKRLLSFSDPWLYPKKEGYQIIHSLMAFGSGGLWGRGLGQGYQKLGYLPEPHTDFIFSVIGEELGLWGVLLVISLYLIIFWQAIIIAKNTEDRFGSLAAMGIAMGIGIQVCINMAVTVGLLPTKGLTLPFLSYGGSSLVVNMACVGILMNIGASKKK